MMMMMIETIGSRSTIVAHSDSSTPHVVAVV